METNPRFITKNQVLILNKFPILCTFRLDANLHFDLPLFWGLKIAAYLYAYAGTGCQLRVPEWLRTLFLLMDGEGPYVREISPGQ